MMTHLHLSTAGLYVSSTTVWLVLSLLLPVHLFTLPFNNLSYKRSVIDHPMDLGTITTSVMQRRYDTDIADSDGSVEVARPASNCRFASDVRQVWSNCLEYNDETTLIYQYALQLEDVFNDLFFDWVMTDIRPENAGKWRSSAWRR